MRSPVVELQMLGESTTDGDGANGDPHWAALLIESSQGLLAAANATEAQTFGAQMAGLAGRIYRVGILLYGKKVSFKEIGKWLFYQ